MNTKALTAPAKYLGLVRKTKDRSQATQQKNISRKLPVQRVWSSSFLIGVQVAILVGIFVLWEIAASYKIIDPFFWSQPSLIGPTLVTFMMEGQAFTDITFTFRSTIFRFLIGTIGGSLLGMSFWWSRNYALVMQPYIICLEIYSEACSRAADHSCIRNGTCVKGSYRNGTDIHCYNADCLCRRAGRRQGSGEAILFLGASRWQIFQKLGHAILHSMDHLDPAGEHRACADRRNRRRIRSLTTWPRTYNSLRWLYL